jgi:sugar-specific transcriptional regulator TrmB
MSDLSSHEDAVESLQELGLKEYESKCFVALSRISSGTAKEISEISEVPRTRVYDATGVLESKGLVEVQHSNPQRFRAVDVSEAAEILRAEYEQRIDQLVDSLHDLEPVTLDVGSDDHHQVWSLSGTTAVTSRTTDLIDNAEDEVVMVVGDGSVLTDSLVEALDSAAADGVDLLVGVIDDRTRELIDSAVPDATVFISGLEWLQETDDGSNVGITRLLLVDRDAILVGSVTGGSTHSGSEHAVFGRGLKNGLVVIARRLLSTGRVPQEADD